MPEGQPMQRIYQPCGNEIKINVDEPGASILLARALEQMISEIREPFDDLVVLCVGTDRSTGDSLGPLVGHFLLDSYSFTDPVYGTLESPVHASNLRDTINWMGQRHRRPLVVAIDACLGRLDSVGTITAGRGALRPGAGVNKDLPPVGEIYITGVVNVGGFMEYFVLQNTRLSLVVKMSKVIATAVRESFSRLTQTAAGV